MAAVARSPPPPPPNKPRKTALLKGGTQAVVYAAPPASAQQVRHGDMGETDAVWVSLESPAPLLGLWRRKCGRP